MLANINGIWYKAQAKNTHLSNITSTNLVCAWQGVPAQELYPHALPRKNQSFSSLRAAFPSPILAAPLHITFTTRVFSVRLFTEVCRLLLTASCNSNKSRNTSTKREICLYPCIQSWGGTRDWAEGLRPHCPGSWSWFQRRKKAEAELGGPQRRRCQ